MRERESSDLGLASSCPCYKAEQLLGVVFAEFQKAAINLFHSVACALCYT